MKYELIGKPLPVVVVKLDTGESILSEAGAMSWMSDGVSMKTHTGGGLGQVFSRSESVV